MKNTATNKKMAKGFINAQDFEHYASTLDDGRLDMEYRQQCLMAKEFIKSGLTYFPLKDALGKEILTRETNQ